MSIHLYDNNTYTVQPIAPTRGAEYEARNRPGGGSANKRRSADRGTDLNSADGGRVEQDSARSLSFPNFAPNPKPLDKAGGADRVPGDGCGARVDMWL